MGLAFSSCSAKQEELSGIYIIKGLNNNLDTLKILRNGTYVRTLYAQSDRRLLFKNEDKWRTDGDRILLYNFLPDEDDKYLPKVVLGPGAMLCDLPVRRQFGRVVSIEAPRDIDEAFYEKL
ncbi:hypothetical protein [Hymenobacter cheonanensis]|uniref:hypothetical protein n=1 Tax=Hymenobacter sp. CA2-7 TaxID=3063993 RepID=UPI00271326BB|nr:hypothetical protein [Hymenobacter sp. CA2-7]MDO7886720.1 hypothetical protein [Hymenobacter sp. CA2-7]